MKVKFLRDPTEEEIKTVRKWSRTSRKILNLIKSNGIIDAKLIQKMTGYKINTVYAQLSILRKMNLIRNVKKHTGKFEDLRESHLSKRVQYAEKGVLQEKLLETLDNVKTMGATAKQLAVKLETDEDIIAKQLGDLGNMGKTLRVGRNLWILKKYKDMSKPFFKFGSIRIYRDDILMTNAIGNDSVDLIVTSPPYDIDIKYEGYDDSIPYDKYLEFTKKWLERCLGFVKSDGRMCLNIPLDKLKGGGQSVYADIVSIAKEVGWKYHTTIIWNEQNISRRTAWGSWLSASAPFVIAPVEMIAVMYKNEWRKTRKGKSDITRDEFLEWTNGVWNFSGENRVKVGHPAPFPVELPRRCIKLFSFVGDVVLDPFLGSGSTLIACLETNRVGIGVEINKNYCELAVRRLEKYGIYQRKLDETV